MPIVVERHPRLAVSAFTSNFKEPLGDAPVPDAILRLHSLGTKSAFEPDEETRLAIRDVLRWSGYKPTGRGKPASEYLVRASNEGSLASINLAVDACNAVSLHTGFPISVIDLARAEEPLRIGIAEEGATYVFNSAGQEIDLSGLICLSDAAGPCANPVRDSQRTKTTPGTVSTLSIVWAAAGMEARLERATAWYRELLEGAGVLTAQVETSSG